MTTSRTLSYQQRASHCLSPIGKRLLQLMETKRTNLAISADVTTAKELLDLAHLLGPEICVLKTHIDIISDFTKELTEELSQLAAQHDFLLFEDRKFADIGHTVMHQYRGGIYRIADWSHFVNAHSLPGPGIIEGLFEVAKEKRSGLILLAEMSSDGHLMNEHYIKQTLSMAERYPEYVFGFISQRALSPLPQWIYLTPGIKLENGRDPLGQRYNTPHRAIVEHGSDIIIVGRGIISAGDPLAEAKKYRHAAWDAYQQRVY